MANSKKTIEALKKRLAWLDDQLAETIPRMKALRHKILEAPEETGLADGIIPLGAFEQGKVNPAEWRVRREYDDSMKLLARYRSEKTDVESWLTPRKGRPRGKRNETARPPDPAIAAALLQWEPLSSSNPEWSERRIARKLAFMHCPVKTEKARGKFAERLRSAMRNSRTRSQP